MFKKPIVRLIAKSVPKREEMDAVVCGTMGIDQYRTQETTDAGDICAFAGRRCYNSFDLSLNPNLTRVRSDMAEYLENILAHGHGSVLEHASFTFSIENVSRVFTGELNRHRVGTAISEASMRYIRYLSIPLAEIDCFEVDDVEWEFYSARDGIGAEGLDPNSAEWYKDIEKRVIALEQINVAMSAISKAYRTIEAAFAEDLNGKDFKMKKILTSAMRRILPMGIATGGVWTFNVRALRHIIAMRCSEHAEEEIAKVFAMVLDVVAKEEPTLFGDFTYAEGNIRIPKYSKV